MKLASLPKNLRLGLHLLERGNWFSSGMTLDMGKLAGKVLDFFNRLEAEGIDWVLVGAEAVNLYLKRPRATIDVDIVVRAKHLRKAKKVLKEAGVEKLEETEVHFKGTISPEPNRLFIDVIKSGSHALCKAALDRKVVIDRLPVARLEALLALKYLSMTSPWRAHGDKFQDASDFIRAFKENAASVDRALLIELASQAHKSARKEFVEFLENVENDRPITI